MKKIIIFFFWLTIYQFNSTIVTEQNSLFSESNKTLKGNTRMKYGIKYDSQWITNFVEGLDNYNFLERNNIIPIIKDQADCGACWSFAATTALSYRFHLIGIKVNLSPQYALSCVKKVCEGGFYHLLAALDLYYNGTITEECFPYSSSSGNVESCPLKCKDGSNLIKSSDHNLFWSQTN